MLLYRGQTLGNPRTEADTRPQLGTQGWHRACDGHDIRPACWMKGRRRGLAFTQVPPEFGSPSAQKSRTQALSPTATSATAPGARSITREPAASPFATPTPSDTTTTPRSRDSVRGPGRCRVPGSEISDPGWTTGCCTSATSVALGLLAKTSRFVCRPTREPPQSGWTYTAKP